MPPRMPPRKGRASPKQAPTDHLSCSEVCRKIIPDKDLSMVRIGIVGVGFMGMIHYLASAKLQGAKVVALCSRDKKKLNGDWRSIQGNFGPRGEMMDLTGVKKYPTLDEMLADKDIDLIHIS